jgi:CheY-like chemotaxis protein
VQPDVPDAVVGDAGRLRQVLLNLVGNAVKFTEVGEVELRVEVAGDLAPQDVVVLRFTVRDTGIGIPPDKQDSIFRAFEQEDTSTTRKYGGTGLGLTIAARLVAMMDGQITVESEPRRGSTFAFTAHFGRQAHPSEQLAGPSPLVPPILLRDLRVLIVDDNATNRRILEEWLRGWQMEPAAVGDGLAAMDALWDAVSARRPYTLVLLDARMPDNDGLALAARIRKRAELAATRIILLTSGDRPGNWNRIRELQIHAHLLKPLQQDELLETIYRVMSRGGEAPSAAGSARRREPAPTAAPLRVLVAEDNEFNAKLMQQLLGRRGHRVRVASNGRDALALANDHPFDVMLLDIHMPELDGFQVVKAIRERERTTGGRLPIIALTARSQKEDREQCLAAGMDDFLAKPIQAAVLWEVIHTVTGRAKGSAPDSGAPVATARLIDPHVLLAACDEDPAILKSICDSFRAQMPGHLADVIQAARNGDVHSLRMAAHKLLGMVAAFSSRARDLVSEIEDLAAQGQFDEATALIDPLSGMMQGLERVLDNVTIEGLRHELDVSQPGDPV